MTAIGIVVAAPLGVAVAVWLSEYARPAGLARAVESGVETIAGTPSVVLAIFGLLVFSQELPRPSSRRPRPAARCSGARSWPPG